MAVERSGRSHKEEWQVSRPKFVMTVVAAAATVASLALAGCNNSGNNQASSSTQPTSVSAAQDHNQADVTFAQHMIPHHQQAIEMSDVVLAKQGIDPRVVDLANKIKAAQGPEIQQMQSWLTQWGAPTMSGMPGMPGMSGMPGMPGMSGQSTTPSHSMMPGMEGMQGMMSPEDMTALQNAQGVEASKLFLQQMIQHHQGAITMAQNEINTGQYAPAIALARSIATSQQQEIKTMQDILASL
jgi:uncharacterized protein (DUF305 family)